MPVFTPTHPFQPAPGLEDPHAQTLHAALARRPRLSGLQRERVWLKDGDFLDLEVLEGSARDAPLLLLLHGLEGSSRSGYIRALLAGAAARGWGAVALNFRSCSGESNRLPRFYHSGETGDVRELLGRLGARGWGPRFAVGFSLGANVLLKLLAEDGERSPITAAAAISTPFDLQTSADALDLATGVGSVYRRVFLRSLKRKAMEKARRFPGSFDVARIRAATGVREFDDVVTAPIHGFNSAEDYYRRSSSGPLLGAIRRPTLLLSSSDDPLAPGGLPASAKTSPWLHLLETSHGGHVGFVEGQAWRPRWWADAQVLRFLEQQRESVSA